MNNVVKSKKRAQEVQLTRDEKRFKLFPEVELFPVVGITELVGRAQLYHHVRSTKLLREPDLHVLPLEGMRKLLREVQLTLHVRRKKLFREAELFADVASVESFQEVNSMAFEGGAVKLEQKGPAKLHVIGGPFMCKRSVGLFLYRGVFHPKGALYDENVKDVQSFDHGDLELRKASDIKVIIGSDSRTTRCRQLTRRPKVKRCRRDREPSRINTKKVMSCLRRRSVRSRIKCFVRKCTPNTSRLNEIARNYKSWYVNYLHRSDSFFSKHLLVSVKMVKNLKHLSFCQRRSVSKCPWYQNKREKRIEIVLHVKGNSIFRKTEMASKLDQERLLYAANTKVLLSGDVEVNPGPIGNGNCRAVKESLCSLGSCLSLLIFRLSILKLKPLDVGGGGNCFFKAVSHQMFGVPDYHKNIRAIGIEYLRNHPERFIESNIEMSWIEYLNNMSQEGNWAHALIIQATADSLNLKFI